DGLVLVRARDREDTRMRAEDLLLLDAETARDDDAAVLGQRLADGRQALLLGRVEKAAGVDDDGVGALVVGNQLIALSPEARDEALAVDERFRTAERDDADLGHSRLRPRQLPPGLGGGGRRCAARARL